MWVWMGNRIMVEEVRGRGDSVREHAPVDVTIVLIYRYRTALEIDSDPVEVEKRGDMPNNKHSIR